MSYSSKPNKPPPVVMDERSAPVYGTSYSAFGSVFGAAVSSSTVGTSWSLSHPYSTLTLALALALPWLEHG